MGVDLSAYRIVQEALANVHRHGGGAAAVLAVHYEPDRLSVTVTILGAGPTRPQEPHTQGLGLIGIRERVALHGGELHTGPLPAGGFKVRFRLPLAPPRD
ncbi:ATP-binding protein [Kitasatospora sp. LaBMicrA B282]|uniref:ATP-binding protein n=1 Tax=Kitasatospora sp. LaBMicrA B282 TaxID=3420949 RepID=UPI003D0FF6FD